MIFPSFVALSTQIEGDELFMTCTSEDFLEFSSKAEVPSIIARFIIEKATNNDDLVHIRSCYKNMYLCRRYAYSENYIAAASTERVEDKNDVKCTLFKVKDLGSLVMTLTHVQSGYQVLTTEIQYLAIGSCATSLKVVRYDDLTKLPKRAIFKGDNGKYLRCRTQAPFPIPTPFGGAVIEERHEYNEFTSNDGSDRSAHYEFKYYNGRISIKSVAFDRFLRRSNDKSYNSWIWGDCKTSIVDYPEAVFKVENLGNNVIALRSLGNNKVCKRVSEDRLENCLRATETYTTSPTRLIVEEPVSCRKIDAHYDFDAAKITSRKLKDYTCATGINNSKDREDEISLSFTTNVTRNTTWNKTTTITKSVNAEINIPIPKIGDGKFNVSGQIEDVERLEKGSNITKQMDTRYTVQVPPMTKVILIGYTEEVTYDIPFSYIQSDVYTTGEKATMIEAGVCQGFEAYDTHYEKKYIKL